VWPVARVESPPPFGPDHGWELSGMSVVATRVGATVTVTDGGGMNRPTESFATADSKS
jgi:hypothetical protein